jgi:hypothetical protein
MISNPSYASYDSEKDHCGWSNTMAILSLADTSNWLVEPVAARDGGERT